MRLNVSTGVPTEVAVNFIRWDVNFVRWVRFSTELPL
jgi:hypothetical protein